ncbi:ankyrin, partial [Trichoderma reesei RUT C-30]
HKVAQLGGDALIAATKAGHIGIVDMLSKAGISMDKRDELGQTALFHAVRRHDKPLIDLLIDRGVDKGASDHQDKTAWVLAIEEGDWELIIRLLDETACSRFPQAWNQTPIQWARKRGHGAAAAILEELQ